MLGLCSKKREAVVSPKTGMPRMDSKQPSDLPGSGALASAIEAEDSAWFTRMQLPPARSAFGTGLFVKSSLLRSVE